MKINIEYKRQGWAIAYLFLVISTATPSVSAEKIAGVLSLRRFELLDNLSGSQSSSELDFYLMAVADSLSLSNRYLESDRKPRIFCSDQPVSIDQLRDIVRERIKSLAKLGQDAEQAKERTGVVIAVIQKLRETYPCK